ncbi:MAG: Zn-dependent exopeptidase M28 [Myxococcales bacterium]|nr:Zn-dependent exopeptidase M28 [Myxococcales bacterium]
MVRRLSGAEPISTGVTLSDRASAESRTRAQRYIEAELEALGLEPVRHSFGGTAPGVNVTAELPGDEPGIYILGAHYDSVLRSPGVNDNATGVAAVLAVARILKEREQCLRHGITFAFFDQEEVGLVGSRAYASQLETSEVLGVITLDQLGWDGDGDRRLEAELPGSGMLAELRASIEGHGLGVEVVETSTAGSDHTAFREQGILAMGISEEYVSSDTTPHYHLESDTFETVDLDYLGSSTTVLAALLGDLVID